MKRKGVTGLALVIEMQEPAVARGLAVGIGLAAALYLAVLLTLMNALLIESPHYGSLWHALLRIELPAAPLGELRRPSRSGLLHGESGGR